MACRLLAASGTTRHGRLVQVIARVARLCGVVVQIEPRIDSDDKSRADGHLYFHAQTAMFDVSVIDPGAKTYIKAAQRPLGAASSRESVKIDHYSSRCREQGQLFFPAVLETFGALGVRCRDLISKIEEEGLLNGVKNINGIKVMTYLLRALSFTLQHGNAMMALDGSKKSRSRLT